MPNLESSSKESITGIQSVIMGLRESIDIVYIADESLLGGYIPDQLRNWRGSDFNYENDVYHFLWGIYEKENSSSIGIFFENLYKSIRKFLCCRKYTTCSIKEPPYNSCETCSKFLDNNIRTRLAKYLKSLGYSIDDEGYVIANEGETVEIEHIVNEIRREASFDIGEFLPEDVKTKGKEMSEAYILVYCMENSLRIFVEKICYNQYGDGYIQKIKISTDLERKIKIRKAEEETNKWLSVRGGE